MACTLRPLCSSPLDCHAPRPLTVHFIFFGAASAVCTGNTEPWLLGNESMTMVFEVMAMRETFKPYVLAEVTRPCVVAAC